MLQSLQYAGLGLIRDLCNKSSDWRLLHEGDDDVETHQPHLDGCFSVEIRFHSRNWLNVL